MKVAVNTVVLWIPEEHPTLETDCLMNQTLNPYLDYMADDWIESHNDDFNEFAKAALVGMPAGVYGVMNTWELTSSYDSYTGEYDSEATPSDDDCAVKLSAEGVSVAMEEAGVEITPEEFLFLTGKPKEPDYIDFE